MLKERDKTDGGRKEILKEEDGRQSSVPQTSTEYPLCARTMLSRGYGEEFD